MKYCQNCGAQIDDKAVICVHCGVQAQPNQNTNSNAVNPNDSSSFGMALLGFFIPIVGFIMYAMNRATSPLKAKSSLKGAIVGMIVNFVSVIIFYVFYFMLMFSEGLY